MYSGKPRDIDVVVVIDNLRNIHEKAFLEATLAKSLMRELRKQVDILVFDEESFKENLKPGTVLSGLILGHKILYDKIGVSRELVKLFNELAKENYVYIKRRTWNLSKIAKVKTKYKHK